MEEESWSCEAAKVEVATYKKTQGQHVWSWEEQLLRRAPGTTEPTWKQGRTVYRGMLWRRLQAQKDGNLSSWTAETMLKVGKTFITLKMSSWL